MSTEALLGTAVAEIRPICLDDLLASAALQTRTDRKYFVPLDDFRTFTQRMGDQLAVLEIADRRLFDYESVYFDCPVFSTYRAHLQRRRLRFEIRTRSYLDSGECMLEVKLEGTRNSTVKERVPYPLDTRGRLTDEAHAYITETIQQAYGVDPPSGLAPVLTTRYRRATLTCVDESARLKCDAGLSCDVLADVDLVDGPPASLRALEGFVLVESKAGAAGSSADRMFRTMGVRATSVSKYCVGMAGLHPDVLSNPWHRTLRRYFDWEGPDTSRLSA